MPDSSRASSLQPGASEDIGFLGGSSGDGGYPGGNTNYAADSRRSTGANVAGETEASVRRLPVKAVTLGCYLPSPCRLPQ